MSRNNNVTDRVNDYSLPFNPKASNPDAFISRWDTTEDGVSEYNQVKLPLTALGTYNFFVDWGDGTNDTITAYNQAEINHTYSPYGIYTINITGTIIGWQFDDGVKDNDKIIEIQQWGCLRLGNSGEYFANCENLVLTATDSLDLTGTTTLYRMFYRCYDLGSNGNMNGWDVSHITNMQYMFNFAQDFNQPVGNWDVSNVTDMAGMFGSTNTFNQPIGSWEVSNVTNMGAMFGQANAFNQSINSWDVSNVTTMQNMFYGADDFNQPIDSWDVSNVSDMEGMFRYTYDFNQPLASWDVSSVTDMKYMFSSTSLFNQSLDSWDVSSVTDMDHMFYASYIFNQPLNSWDVLNVIDMTYMFYLAYDFNQPLNNWNVSSVISMNYMFGYAYDFNQPLDNWNISSVTSMNYMFSGVTLLREFYDVTLIEWSYLTLQSGVTFHAGYSQYSSVGAQARTILTSVFSWTITDGGYNSFADKSTLSSDAESPDRDGSFSLNWTSVSDYQFSNYSLYQHTSPIVSIHGSLTLLAEHTTDLSYEIHDYPHDTYYFVVTTNNDFGQRLSDCIEIVVDRAPGSFNLTSDADTPDVDGDFTLSWELSDLAFDYDVYQYSSPITEINSSLTVLAENITDSTLNLQDYASGAYYYLVTAWNIYGTTLTDCIQVNVEIPSTFTFITPATHLTWDAGSSEYIEWSSTGDIGNVKLELCDTDAFVMEIISNTTNDGEFYWVVPLSIGESDSYCIRITDLSDPTVFTYSHYFTIQPQEQTPQPPNPIPLTLSLISLIIAFSVGLAFTVTTLKNRKRTRRNPSEINDIKKGKPKK